MPNILNILKKTVFSKEPFGLLILLAIAMPIAFSTWVALLNNFVIEVSGFSGVEIGWLQSVREIPGFLAVCVIFILFFISEQRLAYISLVLLALAVAVTALFPEFKGLIITTLISSIGFVILTIIQYRNTGKSFNTIFLSIMAIIFFVSYLILLTK